MASICKLASLEIVALKIKNRYVLTQLMFSCFNL